LYGEGLEAKSEEDEEDEEEQATGPSGGAYVPLRAGQASTTRRVAEKTGNISNLADKYQKHLL
jgi:hypothetical protein